MQYLTTNNGNRVDLAHISLVMYNERIIFERHFQNVGTFREDEYQVSLFNEW